MQENKKKTIWIAILLSKLRLSNSYLFQIPS